MEERAHNNNNKLCNPKTSICFCLLQEIASISSTWVVMGGKQMGETSLMQSQSQNHFNNNMIFSSFADHNR
jgi:hypothetical protein